MRLQSCSGFKNSYFVEAACPSAGPSTKALRQGPLLGWGQTFGPDCVSQGRCWSQFPPIGMRGPVRPDFTPPIFPRSWPCVPACVLFCYAAVVVSLFPSLHHSRGSYLRHRTALLSPSSCRCSSSSSSSKPQTVPISRIALFALHRNYVMAPVGTVLVTG